MTNDGRHRYARASFVTATSLALLLGVAGCGNDPFTFDWIDTPGTVLLYSLAHPEPNLFSAFNFNLQTPVRVEAPTASGTWDMALDTRGGQLVLLPPGALGIESRARIASLPGMSYADVVVAPADTALYVASDPVPVEAGTIYIVKTDVSIGSFGSFCEYYAKLDPISIDVAGGALLFQYVSNPVCNSRDLVPPR